eukprot:6159859-Pyramimonas_sp.AAC.1
MQRRKVLVAEHVLQGHRGVGLGDGPGVWQRNGLRVLIRLWVRHTCRSATRTIGRHVGLPAHVPPEGQRGVRVVARGVVLRMVGVRVHKAMRRRGRPGLRGAARRSAIDAESLLNSAKALFQIKNAFLGLPDLVECLPPSAPPPPIPNPDMPRSPF